MPAKSKKQQRFFGMVHACQKGGECSSPEVKNVAGSISYKDADKFASTKHAGLPEKKKDESFKVWFGRVTESEFDKALKNSKVNSSEFDKAQLKIGFGVEKEHDGGEGKDLDVINKKGDLIKIAAAHLREDPKYYTKLKQAKL